MNKKLKRWIQCRLPVRKLLMKLLKFWIPKGAYCYEITAIDAGTVTLHVRNCPFNAKGEELDSYCNLIGCEIEDSCKSCEINWPKSCKLNNE